MAGVIRHSTKRRCGVEFVAEGNEVAEFEPLLGLQQSLFSAQKIALRSAASACIEASLLSPRSANVRRKG